MLDPNGPGAASAPCEVPAPITVTTTSIIWLDSEPTEEAPASTVTCVSLPTSTDGQCGGISGHRCPEGQCCGSNGYCSGPVELLNDAGSWCGRGCQWNYGNCEGEVPDGYVAPGCATPTATESPEPTPAPSGGPGVVAYFPNWAHYTRADVTQVNFTGVSYLLYAFFDLSAEGQIRSVDTWSDYELANGIGNVGRINTIVKNAYPNLKALISVGGWSLSAHFSTVAASPELRSAFAANAEAFLERTGFDGLDLDWECKLPPQTTNIWPDPTGGGLPCNTMSANDNANFVALLKALRERLGTKYTITIAASASPSRYGNYLSEIAGQLDFINVMTYDFTGNWLAKTGLNSALYSDSQDPNQQLTVDSAIVGFLEAGIPASKLTLGLGFYGHSWQTLSGTNNGLYQTCGPQFDLANPRPCPAPKGDSFDALWTDPCGSTSLSGVWSWMGLRTSGVLQSATEAGSGWERTWREPGKVPTLWNPTTKTFISYDDPSSIAAKVNYAKETGLGGLMVWELSQDYHGELMNGLIKAWSQ